MALHPVGIVPCDGGIQLEKKGWMEDQNDIHEAIDLVTCLVERICGKTVAGMCASSSSSMRMVELQSERGSALGPRRTMDTL